MGKANSEEKIKEEKKIRFIRKIGAVLAVVLPLIVAIIGLVSNMIDNGGTSIKDSVIKTVNIESAYGSYVKVDSGDKYTNINNSNIGNTYIYGNDNIEEQKLELRELTTAEELINFGYECAIEGDIDKADFYYYLALREGYVRALAYIFDLHLQYREDDLREILEMCYDKNCSIVADYVKMFDNSDKNSREVLYDLISLTDEELYDYIYSTFCGYKLVYTSYGLEGSAPSYSGRRYYDFLYSTTWKDGDYTRIINYYHVYEIKILNEEFLYVGYIKLQ